MNLTLQTESSIIALARKLVKIPTQAGVDDPLPAMELVQKWLMDHNVNVKFLYHQGVPVAILAGAVDNKKASLCLNACLDTAPIGDLRAWEYPPFEAHLDSTFLHGRGSADCKMGISIFCHLLAANIDNNEFQVLIDTDEHTGGFAGAHAFVEEGYRPKGVVIGYPGLEKACIGARGFLRGEFVISGTAEHSGAADELDNAAIKAAEMALLISEQEFPPDKDFKRPPTMTVTGIQTGMAYTQIPGVAHVQVDSRLTPGFSLAPMRQAWSELASQLDQELPSREATRVEYVSSWPAYKLDTNHPLVDGLRRAALKAGHDLKLATASPSNIGNLLIQHDIPTVCGFGVRYENMHAADERCYLSDVPLVWSVYQDLIADLAGS